MTDDDLSLDALRRRTTTVSLACKQGVLRSLRRRSEPWTPFAAAPWTPNRLRWHMAAATLTPGSLSSRGRRSPRRRWLPAPYRWLAHLATLTVLGALAAAIVWQIARRGLLL